MYRSIKNFHFPGDFYFSSKFQEIEVEFQEKSRRFPEGGHPVLTSIQTKIVDVLHVQIMRGETVNAIL